MWKIVCFLAFGSVSRQKMGKNAYNSCNDDKMILSKQQISPSPYLFHKAESYEKGRKQYSEQYYSHKCVVRLPYWFFHLFFGKTIRAFIPFLFHHVSSDKSNDGGKKVLSRSSVIIVIHFFATLLFDANEAECEIYCA